MKRLILLLLAILLCQSGSSQVPGLEAKNWYFGTGTDGIVFDASFVPSKVSTKMSGIGFEGMVVVSDPLTGNLLFYSDGQNVVTSTHVTMFNGTGLFGHFSGAQTVQCLPVPAVTGKYYLLTNRAWDAGSGFLYYSTVDFTDPLYPLGKVTGKNTLVSNLNYSQGNLLISQPCTSDYWWVGHLYNTTQYVVIPITAGSFGAPVVYNFPSLPVGDCYAMCYSPVSGKLAVTGLNSGGGGTLGLILFDFNSATGVLSAPVGLGAAASGCGNFSPDGSKLYFMRNATGVLRLHQYDLSTGVTTNMGTCCYAHDTKTAQNGKMYHIHTYYSTTPLAVIDFPNLSAIGNACNYNASAGIAGLFNGEVRRFPEFVVPQAPCVLPIRFVDFRTEQKENGVQLSWKLSEEGEEGHFEIEKGFGVNPLEKIGSVPADHTNQYTFPDELVGKGDFSYRIRFVDTNGEYAYSEVRHVNIGQSKGPDVSVFPNPCVNSFTINLGDPEAGAMEIVMVDMMGKVVLNATADQSPANIDVSGLSEGIYLVRVSTGGESACKKIRVEK